MTSLKVATFRTKQLYESSAKTTTHAGMWISKKKKREREGGWFYFILIPSFWRGKPLQQRKRRLLRQRQQSKMNIQHKWYIYQILCVKTTFLHGQWTVLTFVRQQNNINVESIAFDHKLLKCVLLKIYN